MPSPFRFTMDDWRAAKVHVAETLMGIARAPDLREDQRNITYKDLTLSIQDALPHVRIFYRGTVIRTLLNEVSQASHELEGCWITSLVVRQDFRRPGKGLREYLQKQGKTMQDVLEEQRAAVSFLRSDRAEQLLARLRTD